MNKKFTKLIAFLLVLTTLLFTACSSNKTTHVHDFIVQSSDAKFLSEEATCSSPALYYLSCSCGEKGDKTFEFGTKSTHEYTQKIENDKYLKEEATCSSPAVYYKACKWCAKKGTNMYTFKAGETLEHDFTEEIASPKYLSSEATTEMCAKYFKSCKCGATGNETFDYGYPVGYLKEIDVYLIAGQSNASGYSFHDNMLTEKFSNVWYAGETDKFRSNSTPTSSNISSFETFSYETKAGFGRDTYRIGPEYGIAKGINSYYSQDNPALIFKSAAGGTSLQNVLTGESATYGNWYPRSMWASGFTPSVDSPTGLQYHYFVENFRHVFNELKENGYLAKVKGMAWLQGCADVGSPSAYEPLIKTFISDIRNDLVSITGDNTLAQMPFVIGKIATTMGSYNNPLVPPV